MDLLKKIDIFGTKFNFTIFGNSHYNTKFGGVLTFITVALSMAVTFIFGNDLLFRKNPKVITEKLVPVNYSFNYLYFFIFYSIALCSDILSSIMICYIRFYYNLICTIPLHSIPFHYIPI